MHRFHQEPVVKFNVIYPLYGVPPKPTFPVVDVLEKVKTYGVVSVVPSSAANVNTLAFPPVDFNVSTLTHILIVLSEDPNPVIAEPDP